MPTAITTPTTASPSIRQKILHFYERGLYLQAYQLAREQGPLEDWSQVDDCVLGGRLAYQLCGSRLALRLHKRAWRLDKLHPEACYYRAYSLLQRLGPLVAWKFIRDRGEMPEADLTLHADWLALHATVTGVMRDFDVAEYWLAKAEELAPDRAWIFVERSALLERQDRCEEALVVAQKALAVTPWHRPAVQSAAHLLQQLGRDEEALKLLTEAVERLESPMVVTQLALLQTQLELHEDSLVSYRRFGELAPLADKRTLRWLAARKTDAAYHAGEFAAAAEFAKEVDGDRFYQQLAAQLPGGAASRSRVLLPVGFVRQHYKTCVPAVLTAISRFWSMPAEHLEIAAEICYDGTPAHSERRWAEANGCKVVEFTVTLDSARALLDRGVPFTLTLSEPDFAHLQAAIGYDSLRGTLLVRDPSMRYHTEHDIKALLERNQATGPRGMALVPLARAELLDGLDLPDAPQYDQLYRMQLALQMHDRGAAHEMYSEMQALPNHRLTLHARRILSIYDANPQETQAAIEGLLALYPEDPSLHLARIGTLTEVVRRSARLEALQARCAQANCEPVFLEAYGRELASDARAHPIAARLLHRFLRFRPTSSRGLHALAGLLWAQRKWADATELYRWAMCIEDFDEGYARDYFAAARHLHKTDEALNFLAARFRKLGSKSGLPGRTYFWGLEQVHDYRKAFEVLDQALALRPNDGDLLLFAAEKRSDFGEPDRGAELLALAADKCRRTSWLRTSAVLALRRAEHADALKRWQEVLAVEPLALDAHREVAMFLAETEGRPAALEHLRNACEKYPHHYGLHALWVEWLRQSEASAEEAVVRRLLEIHPHDAWARRELALVLADMRDIDGAFEQIELAHKLDPNNPSCETVRGRLLAQVGRTAEAREAYRRAIRLSVDFENAIDCLIGLCETHAEREEALAFVQEQLATQVIFGGGLLLYRDLAVSTLEPAALLASVRKGWQARPDLWQTWSALVRQLTEMEQLDEALAVARQATERFPLLPAVWLDLATVFQRRKDQAGEAEALRCAVQINPSWGVAARQLAAAHRSQGRLDQARGALEEIVRRVPLEAANHGHLAQILWELGERKSALAMVLHALRLDPGYNWAWTVLHDWAQQLGEPGTAKDFARALCKERPAEARSWLMLARTLNQPDEFQERLSALDRAVAANPLLAEAYDLRGELLALAGRYDDAIAACSAPVWNGQLPLLLRGRLAWIDWQRGLKSDAIRQMQGLLEQDRNYWWGQELLACWHRDTNDAPGYVRASRGLVRIAPRDSVAYGYLGEALHRNGDREGAKQAYARSVELDPRYVFGALALFDLQLKCSELDAAQATLTALKARVVEDDVRGAEIRLAIELADKNKAANVFLGLCGDPKTRDWVLNQAVDAFSGAGWNNLADDVLNSALQKQDANPHAAWLWVKRRHKSHDRTVAARVEALWSEAAVGKAAISAYVEALGESKSKWTLKRLIRRRGERLRGDTAIWGSTGYALTLTGLYRAAAAWGADYATRGDAAPWMLLNLMIALRSLRREREACEVSRRALQLPASHAKAEHRIWLALHDALAGAAPAPDPLPGAAVDSMGRLHRCDYALLEAIVRLQQADGAVRRTEFSQVRKALFATMHKELQAPAGDPEQILIKRTLRRTARRLARLHGGLSAWLWSWTYWV
jgi:cellulose synthase operon protein C